VVWSDNRQPDPQSGKLPPVGNTVDVKNASYTNTIGAVELKKVWTDPEFDPKLNAFYYARVIQIPTPRWSTYDAKKLGWHRPLPFRLPSRSAHGHRRSGIRQKNRILVGRLIKG
jgi:Protein of unknown function (DUF3604)